MLNQKQAEYFLEIVNCGSITEAAKNLFISQPALSQTIKNIEKTAVSSFHPRDFPAPTD